MLLAEGRGHEHLHILSNDLIFPTSEQTLGSGIERLNDTPVVDHHRRVRHGIEHRPEMRLAGAEDAGGLPIVDAGAVKLLAEPGDADADGGKNRDLDEFGCGQGLCAAGENARQHAESRGEQAGAQSADTGGKQNGRDEQQEGAIRMQVGA